MAPKRKANSRYTQMIAAIATASLSLICLLIVLSSGTGLGRGSVGWLSFAVIDCSKIETKVDNHTFRGLPDVNDFSRQKDFFAIYLWTYCSGYVADGTSDLVTDFCAKSGPKVLHNLYQYWNIWGSQMHKTGTRFYWLEHGPDNLYIAYIVAVVVGAINLLVAHRAFFNNRVPRSVLFLGPVTFAMALTTAATVQFTYGQLINRAGEPDMRTTASKHGGHVAYALTWTAAGLALASLGIWSQLFGSNPIRRAPTLDTKQPLQNRRFEMGATSAAESPVFDRDMLATPLRKRAMMSSS